VALALFTPDIQTIRSSSSELRAETSRPRRDRLQVGLETGITSGRKNEPPRQVAWGFLLIGARLEVAQFANGHPSQLNTTE
jgi:hypothetical protein